MGMRTRNARPILLGFVVLLAVPAQWMAQQTPVTPAESSDYTIKSEVNVVVVPTLVRDRHGHAVEELKKEDFQIFDNGKPRVISGLTVQKRQEKESGSEAMPSEPGRSGVVAPGPKTPNRFVVFLFDDMHLSIEDLAQAQKASANVLATSLTDTDMAAVVSMSGLVNSGLTFDRAKLLEAAIQLKPRGLYRSTEEECPHISYYLGDLIQNKHNSNALEAAIDEVMSCNPGLKMRDVAQRLAEGAASQAVALGEQDIQTTLAAVNEWIRSMAKLPGQRTLILVSPGFLILSPGALARESEIMDAAARADVILSAIDARGLYVTEIDASERGGASASSTQLKTEYRRTTMSANENVMAELADATGGTYFHNNNDLEGGFRRLTAAPEYLYLLEFSLNGVKPDGRYHELKVKVDDQDLKVQARRGYFAERPAKKKK